MILELLTLSQITNPKIPPQPPEPTIIVEISKPKPKTIKHKVERGDTLVKIAKKYDTKWERIYYKNKSIKNPDLLEVGQALTIPSKSEKLKKRKIPHSSPKASPEAPKIAQNGSNTYQPGQCTHFVASHRYVPNGWGDATNWKYAAQRAGWTVSSKPVAGAIGWTYGHVVYVESVNSGSVVISEQNYDWNSGIRTITVPITKYLYLY